jgi:hypothetical protein
LPLQGRLRVVAAPFFGLHVDEMTGEQVGKMFGRLAKLGWQFEVSRVLHGRGG